MKVAAVRDYLYGIKSIQQISDELLVCPSSVRAWINNYRSKGEAGLFPQSKNASYSKELKTAAVEDYLAGNGSLRDISMKYGLRSKNQLQTWTLKYNGHEEIKSSNTGGDQTMTKGRATSLEERIEIVKYCIESGKNYKETSLKYQVSYQQVRSWTMNFEELGIDGLVDR